MQGWVYIVSNENLDGWSKIGRTESHPVKRLNTIQSSTVAAPGAYVVEYAIRLHDHELFEAEIQTELRKQTLSDNEWFVVEPFDAGNLFKKVLIESKHYICDEVYGQLIPPSEMVNYPYVCGVCYRRVPEWEPIFDNPDKRRKNRDTCSKCWK